MANRLGKIYGTEEDKVNCNFYFKIGACRHGDKCNRIHNKPSISQTILFKHLYINPPTAIAIAEGNKVSDEALQEALKHFENFYEDIFLELAKYGELLELNVCDNIITNVELVCDDLEYYGEKSYKIFVFAEDRKIKLAQIDGDDGNGYYGTGYDIIVKIKE